MPDFGMAILRVPFIILFLIYAVRGWKKPMTRILTYTAASMAVFSLGPYLHIAGVGFKHFYLPWAVMLHLPFISDALPARLGLYTSSLALILVMQGADESARQMPLQPHRLPLKLNSRTGCQSRHAGAGRAALVAAPALVQRYHAARQRAILRSDRVVTRYIGHEPTLVLYDQDFGFSVVMGMLAASNDYGLVTSNIYGSSPILARSTSYLLNGTFMQDTNGKDTDAALLRDLPQLGCRQGDVCLDRQCAHQLPAPDGDIQASGRPSLPIVKGWFVVWMVLTRGRRQNPIRRQGGLPLSSFNQSEGSRLADRVRRP